ncbi:glutathione S-transferase family protein [Sphingomonas sp. RT2P30]|uniref:glutathione S-transferase family protein n=1 Tax=Parasphingomonas halimpatiens TaxID=3096162 RepID=UPI002FC5EF78
MHLLGSTASPFVQRVLMTARAKGAELDVHPPLGGKLTSPEFLAISPMGRVPVLVLDDGLHLCESEAIACYLDETLPGAVLMPDTPLARARVREIVAITLAEVAAGLRPLMMHLVFRMPGAPELVAAARSQLGKGLDALDRLLNRDGLFAAGATLTAADCALVPILTLTRIVDPLTGAGAMVAERDQVAAYDARIAANPVAARTIAEMTAGFAAMMTRNAAAG